MNLVREGKCKYQILVAKDASMVEQFATKELRNYLKLSTGIQLPIRLITIGARWPREKNWILVACLNGHQTLQDLFDSTKLINCQLNFEGFVIQNIEENLCIVGADERGVLYGVYAFLEEFLGIRWVIPGAKGEVIPKHKNVIIPEKFTLRVEGPKFSYRALINYSKMGRKDFLDFVDWLPKRRFNCLVFNLFMVEETNWLNEIIVEAGKRGLKLEAGHHSFSFWVPANHYWKSHPEYFPMIGGQRVWRIGSSDPKKIRPNVQLCLSSLEILSLMEERIKAFANRYPDFEILGIYPNDGFGWCECKFCSAFDEKHKTMGPSGHENDFWAVTTMKSEHYLDFGVNMTKWLLGYETIPGRFEEVFSSQPNRSALYFDFVTRLANRLKNELPNRLFNALAYLSCIEPPQTLILPENVMLTFAAYYRCVRHPLAKASCERNRQYWKLLMQWKEHCRGSLVVFDWFFLPDYLSLPYWPILKTMAEDMTNYQKIGVQGFLLEYRAEQGVIYGVLLDAFARLCWSDSYPLEEIIHRFFLDTYGKALGKTLYNCFLHIEESLLKIKECCHYYNPDFLRFLPESVIDSCRSNVEVAIIREDKMLKELQGSYLLYLDYLRALRRALVMTAKAGETLTNKERSCALEALKQAEQAYKISLHVVENSKDKGLFYLPTVRTVLERQIKRCQEERIRLCKQENL